MEEIGNGEEEEEWDKAGRNIEEEVYVEEIGFTGAKNVKRLRIDEWIVLG